MFNVKSLLGSMCLLGAMAVGSLARGDVTEVLDFSTDPVDSGWTYITNALPWLNTGAGEWQVNADVTEYGVYVKDTLPAGLVNSIHHGTAEITATTTLPSITDEVTVVWGQSSSFTGTGAEWQVYVRDGNILVRGGRQLDNSRPVNDTIPAANTDGLKHIYGWQLDDTGSTPILKVFYDGVQVGAAGGYDVSSPFFVANTGQDFYFGDGTTGFAHQEVWDRWTLEPGPMLPPALPGDVNFDNVVNIFDINLVSANWGDPGGAPTGDANLDGVVNIFDINLISANWTSAPGGAAAVPEPGSLVLAAIALAGVVWMVRRPSRQVGR